MKVHLVPKTNNKKTGKVAATYITGDTCPDRCPFLTFCYSTQRRALGLEPHGGSA